MYPFDFNITDFSKQFFFFGIKVAKIIKKLVIKKMLKKIFTRRFSDILNKILNEVEISTTQFRKNKLVENFENFVSQNILYDIKLFKYSKKNYL